MEKITRKLKFLSLKFPLKISKLILSVYLLIANSRNNVDTLSKYPGEMHSGGLVSQ